MSAMPAVPRILGSLNDILLTTQAVGVRCRLARWMRMENCEQCEGKWQQLTFRYYPSTDAEKKAVDKPYSYVSRQ
jgi:hypothetical protein